MKISKEDFERLCEVARCLCDVEHEDYEYTQLELWETLNDIIENIGGDFVWKENQKSENLKK